jgi:glycosyltransferase involved in cell wall biosynthesis
MQSLSVVIITFNEEQNIGRCIESVKKVAEEIIVLDSYSTDQTTEIARNSGAIVHQEKFRGYIGQKNFAMQLASNNYILSLDADEALDDKLIASILKAKKTFSFRAYRMNRCTSLCGRFMHHGLWYPDKKIRLFDRRIAKWGGLNPHDKVEVIEGFAVKHLTGDILHHAFNTIEDLAWRNNRISTIAAKSLYNTGSSSSWYKMLAHPAWAFINGYFFRLGFLDGFTGLNFAVNMAHQVFLKYSKLYRLQRSKAGQATTPIIRPALHKTKSAAGEV